MAGYNAEHSVSLGLDYLYTLYEEEDTRILIARRRDTGAFIISKTYDGIPHSSAPDVNWETTDGLLKEYNLIRELYPHQNIIRAYDLRGDNPDIGYNEMLLEYCNGGDVAAFARHARSSRQSIPEAFIWHIFVGVIGALAHMHGARIAHNDIHTGNWLLTFPQAIGNDFPVVKVADFERSSRVELDSQLMRTDVENVGEEIIDFRSIDESSDPSLQWSASLVDWTHRCLHWSASSQELFESIAPIARQRLDDSAAMPLPIWMADYFRSAHQRHLGR